MSNERVYQMPAAGQDIGPADIFEFLSWWADEATDMVPLMNTHETRQHLLSAAKYLRWAAAAERQNMGVVS